MADRELQEHAALYSVGQVILHRLFDYRGVIFDVDPVFASTDAWYEANSRTRSPKDKPWYHVMVHDTAATTYVSERNLKPDDSGDPVRHPLLDEVLKRVRGGGYQSRGRAN
jgi:heat shock protein HspQ